MGFTIFYAWQNDRPTRVCRYFIREALEVAIAAVSTSLRIDDAPKLDHDTKGVPGTPHIADTIFEKIKNCGIFVADLTFVGRGYPRVVRDKKLRGKRLPNPNVLIELGHATATVGWERTILLMNDAFGPPSRLPFDLRHRSFPIVYTLTDHRVDDVKNIKRNLAKALEGKIKTIIDSGVIEKAALAARQRSVEVRCSNALAEVGANIVRLVTITAANTGPRPVTISSAGLVLSDGRFLVQPRLNLLGTTWPLPKRLLDGECVSVPMETAQVVPHLVKARATGQPLRILEAFVADATGGRYTTTVSEDFTAEVLREPSAGMY